MQTCIECKWCIGKQGHFYLCNAVDEIEYVHEEVALDSDLGCEFYVEELDDNKTEESTA